MLVTGATGYIGGRLVPRLLERGWRVRCLVRSARKLERRPWSAHERLEVIESDLTDPVEVEAALQGCQAAYYLIHSMESAGSDYGEHDRRLAKSFASAASTAGVERIIYLGGLGETGDGLSEHLASRREVERVLADQGVPVTVLRAAMIIGSGSASFEILRYLVERLPVMITPKWVSTQSQPIAVRDVLGYLVACLETPQTTGRTLDIGGPDVLTYHELMQVLTTERGLPKRLVIPVPILTPRLSSLWIHLVTPLNARIARPLAAGLRNRVVCRDDEAARLMPRPLLSVREAISEALTRHDSDQTETSWSDAGPMPGDPDWSGGTVFTDRRQITVDATPEAVHRAACRIGGGQGYYSYAWLWRLRGRMDRLVGGPGLRRGRRHPESVGFGDALDFWRVSGIEPARLLELRAEMRLPGIATLSFEIEPADNNRSTLTQTARFKPKGLLGLLYWYAVLPMHGPVFRGMLQGIAKSAQSELD